MIKILSYNMPDMDGVSCMFAYSEFLNKIGEKCEYIIDGKTKKEVNIVTNMYKIKLKSSNILSDDDKIILVDTNEPEELTRKINLKNIVEIIDHHHISKEIKKMQNVKVQIEKVGAAATLIAEKFKNSNISISKNSAILLYYGIVSNTLNFNSNTTNDRDKNLAEWLKKQANEELEKKIEEIFEKKSIIDNSTVLRNEMDMEYKNENLKISWSMGQLELVNVKKFVKDNKQEIIRIMEKIKNERNINYLSVNCIDILNGYTIIISIDNYTEKILSKVLGIKFENNYSIIPKIITRKEISEEIWKKYGK